MLGGGIAAPSSAEVAAAHSALDGALRAAGLRGLRGRDWSEESESVLAARDLLLRNGWVFPPASNGLCLAKVRERTQGLSKRLWGRTIRYRRVRHGAPVVYDLLVQHGALGVLPPLGRWADRTVFLDEDALARRAGRGRYAAVSLAQLREQVELEQVAAMAAARGAGSEAVARRRVWLTLLRYGELPLVRARLELSASREDDPEGPATWVLRVARPDGADPTGTRRRAEAVYERLSGR